METNIHQLERGIEASGIDFTHLRINVLLQNYSTMSAPSIRHQGVFAEPVEDERTSFVDARDVAAVAAAALSEVGHTRQAYTLTGAAAYSIVALKLLLLLLKQPTSPSITNLCLMKNFAL